MEDIIYLEVDSEITEAIDKLKNANGLAVKLVVPARSSLLQSAVNIKLLNKAAKDAKKELALITNDKTAKHLAGSLGIAVASNVKAEPEVPEKSEQAAPDIDEAAEMAEMSDAEATASKSKKNKKTEATASSDAPTKQGDFTTRQLADAPSDEPANNIKKKPKTTKIPNYNNFQKRLLAAGLIVAGVVVLIVLFNVLPTAKVTLNAQADKKAVLFDFGVDGSQTSSDPTAAKLAAKQLTEGKDVTSSVTATGKKDVGTKATGTIQLSNSASSSPVTLPAGTNLSANGKTFSLNQSTTIPGASVSGGGIVAGHTSASITATASGDSYNLNSASFSVSGQPPQVSGSGTTSGGTSKVINVLSQADLDKAKADLTNQSDDTIKQDLNDKAGKSYTVFADTFTKNITSFNSNVAADSEATNATITAHIDYSELAAANDQLDALFDNQIHKDLKSGTDIYQNGRADATFSVKAKTATTAMVTASVTAYVGASINKSTLAKSLAGKPKKSAEDIVKQAVPSAQSVTVSGLPFWPWLPIISSHVTIAIRVQTD